MLASSAFLWLIAIMSKKPTAQPQDKYVMRMPDGMREALKAEAWANNRSLNAEIVLRLEEFESLKRRLVETEAQLDRAFKLYQEQAEDLSELVKLGPEGVLYVALDARGFPISWTEVMAHMNAITRAGHFNIDKIEARVFDPKLVNSDEREAEWWEVVQHYRALAGHPPLPEIEDEEHDQADDDGAGED